MAPGPGFSQEVGLTRGEASLSSGQYEIAVQQLSATVNDGKSTVEQAAKDLGYEANSLARGLRSARSFSVSRTARSPCSSSRPFCAISCA